MTTGVAGRAGEKDQALPTPSGPAGPREWRVRAARAFEAFGKEPAGFLPLMNQGPECPCGGPTDWDGHKFRCRGCGLYYETCCDGGRCPWRHKNSEKFCRGPAL